MSGRIARLAALVLIACAAAAHAQQFRFSGGIYLFEYLPRGASDKFEIYALVLNGDSASDDGRYGLHVQGRARDSKLRPYFASTVWFQEAYAYAKTPAGDVRAGKFYRKVGLFWDDSFWGNIHYFNGLKLNPDYGVELSAPTYSLQYLNNNDHVAGSLDGRDVESDPEARLRLATGRYAPTLALAGAKVTLGASAARGRIERPSNSFAITQLAADATVEHRNVVAYAEVLRQNGDDRPGTRAGYASATYLLGGVRWQARPRLNARVNVSRAGYRGGDDELEIVPGIVFTVARNISFITEVDHWKRGGAFVDRSLNLVVHYTFRGD